MPYIPNPKATHPQQKNPEYKPQVWQKANCDDFDVTTDTLRDSLRDTPQGIADSVWQDFLSWLGMYRTNTDFGHTATILVMEEHFNRLLQDMESSAWATSAMEADINKRSSKLADTIQWIDTIDKALDVEFPLPGFDPKSLNRELASLCA